MTHKLKEMCVNRDHMPQGTQESAKKSVIEREGRSEGEAGRQMPGANAHRKHIGCDSEI